MTELFPGQGPGAAAPAEPARPDGLPGAADADGWHRLHPLSPLLRGGLAFVVIIGVIIANARDWLVKIFVSDRFGPGPGESDGGDPLGWIVERGWVLPASGIALAVIFLIVLFSWIAWRFHTYRITGEAVEARWGVLFRQHRRAPLERIQSVNLQRSLLARAVGLTKIDIVTAGQGGKVELSYLGHRDAKAVREQILGVAALKRAGGTAAELAAAIQGGAPTDLAGIAYTEPSDAITERARDFVDSDIESASAADGTLVRVPVGRLVGSILLSWESITVLVLLLLVVVGGLAGALSALAESGPEVLRVGSAVLLGMMVSIVPLLLVFAGIMIGQFNKGFNFAISRGRDAVRIGAGLTSTTTESIPFGRIHAIEARQPLLWRPFGWWKIRVTTAGHSAAQAGQNNVQNVVLPVGRQEDVLRVIDALLPGVGDEESEIVSLRDGLDGPAADYLGAGPRAGWVLWWGRRRAGIRIADAELPSATLRVRRGFLTRSLSIMPIVRAQSVQLRRPLVHRMIGLASLQAHTVLGPVRMEMRGIELAAARSAFEELARTVLRVQREDANVRAGAGDSDPAVPGTASSDTAEPAAGAGVSPDAGAPESAVPIVPPVASIPPVPPVPSVPPVPPVPPAPSAPSAPPAAPRHGETGEAR